MCEKKTELLLLNFLVVLHAYSLKISLVLCKTGSLSMFKNLLIWLILNSVLYSISPDFMLELLHQFYLAFSCKYSWNITSMVKWINFMKTKEQVTPSCHMFLAVIKSQVSITFHYPNSQVRALVNFYVLYSGDVNIFFNFRLKWTSVLLLHLSGSDIIQTRWKCNWIYK